MLLVYGIYNFRPKRVAFRNDFCLFCGRPRRSEQIRSFDVCHVFWIPFLPLGFRRRWRCTACHGSPHVPRGVRPGFKWTGVVVFVILAAIFWGIRITPDIRIYAWLMRVAMPIGAMLVLFDLLRPPKGLSLKQKLATVPPASDTVCPFCGSALLLLSSQCSCPVCGVVRA